MQGKPKIRILTIGRIRTGPEAALSDYYHARLPWPVAIEEYEEKKQGPGLKDREGALLLSALEKKPTQTVLALDEKGQEWNSRDFASFLQKKVEEGDIAFLIGGADGLADAVKDKVGQKIAFGRMTWPHKLARIMLLEQLYRAGQILAQHPYHRD